jgi:anti-sigma factor RsiW
MNPTPAGSGKDPHDEAQRLLPWLTSGTLPEDERARVEQHVQHCASCQADLAWERTLRSAGQPEAPPIDPGAALRKLAPRLDHPGKRTGILARWTQAFAANDSRWLRTIAMAQLGVIAGLALLLLRPGDDASYRTLGAAAHAPGNLVVVFDPRTPERELRRILHRSGARVVDGPTVTEAYVLSVPAPQAGEALARLRSEPSVTLAEPLAAESRP